MVQFTTNTPTEVFILVLILSIIAYILLTPSLVSLIFSFVAGYCFGVLLARALAALARN